MICQFVRNSLALELDDHPVARGNQQRRAYHEFFAILVKFQQRYEKRHGSLPKPLCAKRLCLCGIPRLQESFKQPILGGLIPTEILQLFIGEIILAKQVDVLP